MTAYEFRNRENNVVAKIFDMLHGFHTVSRTDGLIEFRCQYRTLRS